jgi:rubrerythrin
VPQFIAPFSGIVPDQLQKEGMTRNELVRALRQNLAAEEEAAHLYESHIDASHNELVNGALQEIANDEKVHAGKFLRLIEMLTGDEGKYLLQGANEADETYRQLPDAAKESFTDRNFNVLDPLGIMEKVKVEVMKLAQPALPMSPQSGPPLPRGLKIAWPSSK